MIVSSEFNETINKESNIGMSTVVKERVKSRFKECFNRDPILVFSPGRINLIGEHTDYNGGYVFPAAIDKGIVVAIQKSDTDFCTVEALDVDETIQFSLDNILPAANGEWRNYILGVLSEIQKKGKQLGNFNLVFGGDIPDGAGLSSSAALENSIVFGLNELFALGLSKEEMIFISQHAEHNYVGVKCGIMDQYASMFGQKNKAIVLDCRNLDATIVELDLKEYEILLLNTNVKHSLASSAYNERRSVCEKIATLLHIETLREATIEGLEAIKGEILFEEYQKALYVIQENDRVQLASKAIANGDLETLGTLLFASHNGLSMQYKVSCDELDYLVSQAKENSDSLGARMMGGGFGGCVIQLIKKEASERYITDIKKVYQAKFLKECSVYRIQLSDGTHKIDD